MFLPISHFQWNKDIQTVGKKQGNEHNRFTLQGSLKYFLYKLQQHTCSHKHKATSSLYSQITNDSNVTTHTYGIVVLKMKAALYIETGKLMLSYSNICFQSTTTPLMHLIWRKPLFEPF